VILLSVLCGIKWLAWYDADHYQLAANQQYEVTDAEQDKKQCHNVNKKVLSEKMIIFLQGEVFFNLTRPLMGDPLASLFRSAFIQWLGCNRLPELSRRYDLHGLDFS
jgi:hypothetical protein